MKHVLIGPDLTWQLVTGSSAHDFSAYLPRFQKSW